MNTNQFFGKRNQIKIVIIYYEFDFLFSTVVTLSYKENRV